MSPAAAPFLEALVARRTIYALKPELPSGVELKDVKDIVQTIIKHTPTSFNTQGNRAVILTGESHRKVWDHVYNSIPIENFKKRPLSARDEAFGTVVFMVNNQQTKEMQQNFPAWADLFPEFVAHSSGSAQISAWTALEKIGLGAHLQHFNELVASALPEDAIKEEWVVQGQLVFGLPDAPAGEKTFIENEVKVFE
ncbi:putative nitroreductase HBN1 [Lachancea thermotolerans]|uniref:KLTH0F01562p n=1 Tax=Lachancea thermotolerans (strain ATCC 56472 / CBS 6340 / NRRL Y-8284) TaxID=559295 RepID=C5DK40_LACTC|nr:KLTH0F01562p [Lachancea thermotolerans CBS 6340]CAR23841.1 KLTH0F01562p [Lachancea thermotolerans CBS 6340]